MSCLDLLSAYESFAATCLGGGRCVFVYACSTSMPFLSQQCFRLAPTLFIASNLHKMDQVVMTQS